MNTIVMRACAAFVVLLSLATQWGCSHTVVVPVPPRMDLKSYGTIGIVEFSSNSDAALNHYATQQIQKQVQEAYPGTPILELGSRAAVLSAVGATQFDADAIVKIGKKYGVKAFFLGDIVYSEPKTNYRVSDVKGIEGRARTEIRGDMSAKLLETQVGASVWTSSSWAKRQLGNVSVSAQRGVTATVNDTNPRREMVPALAFHLTEDFRPKFVRRPAE